DERKESPRGARPERPRAPREVAPVEAVSQPDHEHDDDKEADLAAAALRHIEEISLEPVIEVASDDEPSIPMGEEEIASPVVAENPRQRRQRRLRYLDREAEQQSRAAAEAISDRKPEEPPAEVESDEETGGRRRRRGRRKRGDDVVAA